MQSSKRGRIQQRQWEQQLLVLELAKMQRRDQLQNNTFMGRTWEQKDLERGCKSRRLIPGSLPCRLEHWKRKNLVQIAAVGMQDSVAVKTRKQKS